MMETLSEGGVKMAKITLDDGTTFEGTVEEIKEFLSRPKRKFNLNDYVKVVEETYYFRKGELAKIIDVDSVDDDAPYYIRSVTRRILSWVSENDIEILTGEEKLKAKLMELGREPDEYKTGDIVVIKEKGPFCDQLGYVIGVVRIDNDRRVYEIELGETSAMPQVFEEDIELVCPVELRFDL